MANWGIVLWLIGLSAITFFAVAWLMDISKRQRQLQSTLDQEPAGTADQESSKPLVSLIERLDDNEENIEDIGSRLERFVGSQAGGIKAIGLVRYQAFADFGGDQSFSLALANEDGDGAVVSGIFARDGSRVYAKPLTAWASSYALSLEEEEAIGQAQTRVQ